MNKLEFVRRLEGRSDAERKDRILEWLKTHDIPYQAHDYDWPDRGTNVIVPVPPAAASPSGKEILAVAHYDAFYFSPGANDDASAVAVLLDFLLEMRSRAVPLRHPLKIIFFDDEEPAAEKNWMGMRGSRAYVRAFGTSNVLAVYNFELCGMGDAVGVWPVTAFNQESFLLQNIRGVLEEEGIYYETAGKLPAFYADYEAFHEAGFPHAVCLTAIPREDAAALRAFAAAPRWQLVSRVLASRLPGMSGLIPRLFRHYHSRLDRSEFLSEESMEMIKRILIRCILRLDREME